MATRIDTITVDVTLSERHSGRVALTAHPVESGMNPTDHARLEPAKYSLEGIFSNFPLPAGRGPVRRDATDTPAKKTSDQFWKLFKDRRAVTIVTGLRTYDNMVMTSLDMPVDPAIGQDVQFSATFDEIRFVNAEFVALTTKPTAVPTQPTDKTKQSKQVPSTATAAQQQSAFSAFDSYTGDSISDFLTH